MLGSRFLFPTLLVALTLSTGCRKVPVVTTDTDAGGLSPEDEMLGLEACCLLGALCHPVDDEGRAGECHDIGHQNNPAVCLRELDSCAATCRDLDEHLDGGAEIVPHSCTLPATDAGESHMDEHEGTGGAHAE